MNRAVHRPYDRLTRDNAVVLLIDHQVGLLWDTSNPALWRRVLGLAKAARLLGVPTIVTAAAPEFWGPILPELVSALPGTQTINRTAVNAWADPVVRGAVQATGRRKLIVAGSAVDVCVALAALAAAAEGHEVYVAMDASGSAFADPTANTLRMLQAGVTVANGGPLIIEMLDDVTEPCARAVYAALDLPFAALIGQQFGPHRAPAGKAVSRPGTRLLENRAPGLWKRR